MNVAIILLLCSYEAECKALYFYFSVSFLFGDGRWFFFFLSYYREEDVELELI